MLIAIPSLSIGKGGRRRPTCAAPMRSSCRRRAIQRTHIMGRVTYEAMAAVWPTTTGVYADVMNEIPKVAFSRTLTDAEWPESRIASGDLAQEIDRLKREPGGVILAH